MCHFGRGTGGALTGDDILRVIRIVVLDETEAVHELNLGDGAVAKLVEEVFDVLSASCSCCRGWLERRERWGGWEGLCAPHALTIKDAVD